MDINTRMDEFEKVNSGKKISGEQIKGRMEEFETASKKKIGSRDKSSTLPFGIGRYKPCPKCGETMEIHEVKQKTALYRCKSCQHELSIEIG